MRPLAALAVILGLCGAMPGAGFAQGNPAIDTFEPGRVQSPVLTVDSERLFLDSLFGQRIIAQIQIETEAFNAEQRRLEAALTEEERSLTLRRPAMSVEDFRAEADDFDTRVQSIRNAQDAKQRSLQLMLGQGREQFLSVATPTLGRLMIESGAAVLMDRRNVIISATAVDVTDAAIAAINAAIGDGASDGASDGADIGPGLDGAGPPDSNPAPEPGVE